MQDEKNNQPKQEATEQKPFGWAGDDTTSGWGEGVWTQQEKKEGDSK